MTSTLSRESRPSTSYPTPGRRFGYAVAVAVNAWFLWFVNRLPDWEWPGFITEEFSEVLPIVSAAIVASIVVNVLFFWYDPAWIKALGNIVTASFGFVSALRLYQVFPFDFTIYDVNWTWLARGILIVAMVGTIIAFIVESVKLVLAPFRS